MALVGVELETLVFEPDAQTTRPPPCATNLKLRYQAIKEPRLILLNYDGFYISKRIDNCASRPVLKSQSTKFGADTLTTQPTLKSVKQQVYINNATLDKPVVSCKYCGERQHIAVHLDYQIIKLDILFIDCINSVSLPTTLQ